MYINAIITKKEKEKKKKEKVCYKCGKKSYFVK
jgi:ribosomal protein L37E